MEADTLLRSAERRFRAMGSDAHLIVVDHRDDATAQSLLDRAQRSIEELERRWSRFVDTSDVSRLTARAGEAVLVAPSTALLVARAIAAWRLSGATFDPTLLHHLVAAGYDRSFDELTTTTASTSTCTRPATRVPGLRLVDCSDIEIEHTAEGATVRLPAGIGFDPGGIGKGLAADLVVAELLAAGAAGVCVNLGGDLRVSGTSPSGGAWTLDVEHPASAQPLARVGLVGGAIATSTTLRRAWSAGGERRHHLIDPDTGAPSTSDLELVSVIASEAWIAEVLAKSVLLRGTACAFDLIDTKVAQALTVDRDGVVRTTPGWDRFAGTTTRTTIAPSPTTTAPTTTAPTTPTTTATTEGARP